MKESRGRFREDPVLKTVRSWAEKDIKPKKVKDGAGDILSIAVKFKVAYSAGKKVTAFCKGKDCPFLFLSLAKQKKTIFLSASGTKQL